MQSKPQVERFCHRFCVLTVCWDLQHKCQQVQVPKPSEAYGLMLYSFSGCGHHIGSMNGSDCQSRDAPGSDSPLWAEVFHICL